MPTSRSPRQNAPMLASPATGTHARSNNAASGAGPSRARATLIAAVDGTVQDRFHPEAQDSPSTSSRITSA